MKELSIFIDESGDFGEYTPYSPYYVVSMVFHDQSLDILEAIKHFNQEMSYLNENEFYIHTMPLIRGEHQFRFFDINLRRKLFYKILSFYRKLNIKHHSFYVEKKNTSDSVQICAKLAKDISAFYKENDDYFKSFDKLKIYYDNGQIELTKVLIAFFTASFGDVEYKQTNPKDYKLSQITDFICSLELLKIKYNSKSLSKTELTFFQNYSILNKNYLKHLQDKEL